MNGPITRWLAKHSSAIQVRDRAIQLLKAENHTLSLLLLAERRSQRTETP